MRTGDLLRQKKEYLIEEFTTKQGLFVFFISTAIWGFFINKYNSVIFGYVTNNIFSSLSGGIKLYISYLSLGFFYSMLGLVISIIIISSYNLIFNGGK